MSSRSADADKDVKVSETASRRNHFVTRNVLTDANGIVTTEIMYAEGGDPYVLVNLSLSAAKSISTMVPGQLRECGIVLDGRLEMIARVPEEWLDDEPTLIIPPRSDTTIEQVVSAVSHIRQAIHQPPVTPPAAGPAVAVTVGHREFNLTIAKTEREKCRGLAWRQSLPANEGMIFIFPREQLRIFWMRRAYFDLDLICLGAGGKVVSIHTMKALDLTPIPSDAPAKFAILINAGKAAEAGIAVGDVIALPKDLPEAIE